MKFFNAFAFVRLYFFTYCMKVTEGKQVSEFMSCYVNAMTDWSEKRFIDAVIIKPLLTRHTPCPAKHNTVTKSTFDKS